MQSETESKKPLLFCLDNSNNTNLKRCLDGFSTRFFHEAKYFNKTMQLINNPSFIPSAFVLTGDFTSIQEVVMSRHNRLAHIFIFCPNFTRQIYEPLFVESAAVNNIIGIFTTIHDLQLALEDFLLEPSSTKNQRQLVRFVTNQLDAYLWYELLKETALKMPFVPLKQPPDIALVNKQLELDPLISLYTHRSSISYLTQETISSKKIFYGTTVKKTLIDELASNLNNLISFNSFVHLQGHRRAADARHESLQRCSRQMDEVSIIFELESADAPTFKIVRVFDSGGGVTLWVAQLVGTQECVKLSKQFSHIKRSSDGLAQCTSAEIAFGQILVEMNEINLAYSFFAETLLGQIDKFNKHYSNAVALWKMEKKYNEAIDHFQLAFQENMALISTQGKIESKEKEENTYFESEIESTWETPAAVQEANKLTELVEPSSYRVDQIIFDKGILRSSPSSTKTKRHCTLF